MIFPAIGIDDMFVIVSCLQNVSDKESLEVRVGQALRHAGTSVTVTTATDVLAFSVGAVTVNSSQNLQLRRFLC